MDTKFIKVSDISLPQFFYKIKDGPFPTLSKEDFEEGREAWRRNKAKPFRKYYRYGCEKVRSNGKLCRRTLMHPKGNLCRYHYNRNKWIGLEQ